MVSSGCCPYCRGTDKVRNDHHIIPRRFTRENGNRFKRLDILFPEYFPSGVNDITRSVCFNCHTRADRTIPFDVMMTPDKYFLIHKKLSSGEEITAEMKEAWIKESMPKIERRQKQLILRENGLCGFFLLVYSFFVINAPNPVAP